MNELEDMLNAYINGSISFLTYREKRSQYINHFVSSSHVADDTIPLSDIQQRQMKAAARKKTQESTSSQHLPGHMDKHSQSSLTSKQYVGLGVLIIAAILAWYYSSNFSASHAPSPAEPSRQDMAPSPTPEKTPNRIEQQFIVNFINMDQWNSASLSEFLTKWQALTRQEKKQARQSHSFIRLKNSLRLRIREQQALQNTPNNMAKKQEDLLRWFASQISVELSQTNLD